MLPTIDYLYGLRPARSTRSTLERGQDAASSGSQAISEPDERGFRTVMATINGQLRPISVRDRAVAADVAAAEKADPPSPGQVAAPFEGVVTLVVAEGDAVAAGDVVATIEAMKMEASITAPVAGTVERLAVSGTQPVDGGDLVLVLWPDAQPTELLHQVRAGSPARALEPRRQLAVQAHQVPDVVARTPAPTRGSPVS